MWWSTNLLPPALCIYFQVCSKVCPLGANSAQLNGSPSCHPEFYMEQKKTRPQRELDCKIAHKIIGSESDRKCYEFKPLVWFFSPLHSIQRPPSCDLVP